MLYGLILKSKTMPSYLYIFTQIVWLQHFKGHPPQYYFKIKVGSSRFAGDESGGVAGSQPQGADPPSPFLYA
jgi:hypothetical protein